jgi:hypothetical protein
MLQSKKDFVHGLHGLLNRKDATPVGSLPPPVGGQAKITKKAILRPFGLQDRRRSQINTSICIGFY